MTIPPASPVRRAFACSLLALPVRAKMFAAKVCTPNIAVLSGAIV